MMFKDFRTVRSISQKWKYEKRLLRTHTKDYLLALLLHYNEMHNYASGCLDFDSVDSGVSHYFASNAAAISREAIQAISSALESGGFREAMTIRKDL